MQGKANAEFTDIQYSNHQVLDVSAQLESNSGTGAIWEGALIISDYQQLPAKVLYSENIKLTSSKGKSLRMVIDLKGQGGVMLKSAEQVTEQQIPSTIPTIISAVANLKGVPLQNSPEFKEVTIIIDYTAPSYCAYSAKKEFVAYLLPGNMGSEYNEWEHPTRIMYDKVKQKYSADFKALISDGKNIKNIATRLQSLSTRLRVQGPESTYFNLSFNFPGLTITHISYAQETLSLKWDVDEDILSGVFCEVDVEKDGVAIITPYPSASYSKGIISFKCNPGNKSQIRIKCRLGYADSKQYSEWTNSFVFIYDKPEIIQVDCEKTGTDNNYSLNIGWKSNAATDNLKMNIYISSAQETITKECNAKDNAYKFSNIELSPYNSYTVYAEYFLADSSGPASEKVLIIHQVPSQFSFNYSEQNKQYYLEATWNQVDQGCTYELKIARDGVWSIPQKVDALSLKLGTETTNAGVIIQGTIRAGKGISIGPWSDPLPAPFISNSTYTFDYLGRLLEVNSDKKQISTFKYDERGNITFRKMELKKG